jgi:putative nucleotide binding protein
MEDKAIVLDVLPEGAPFTLSHKVDSELRHRDVRAVRGGYLAMPLVFGLAKQKLFLLVAVAKQGEEIKPGDEVDLGGKEQIQAWARIDYSDLSSAAKSELDGALDQLIEGEEKRFVEFFNKASPITTRMHSLELLPGIGKKHMWEIIESRRKPFESLDEVKERLPLIADPHRSITERIVKELQGDEKYNLFVLTPRRRRR